MTDEAFRTKSETLANLFIEALRAQVHEHEARAGESHKLQKKLPPDSPKVPN